jgi:hypothetical protein
MVGKMQFGMTAGVKNFLIKISRGATIYPYFL